VRGKDGLQTWAHFSDAKKKKENEILFVGEGKKGGTVQTEEEALVLVRSKLLFLK